MSENSHYVRKRSVQTIAEQPKALPEPPVADISSRKPRDGLSSATPGIRLSQAFEDGSNHEVSLHDPAQPQVGLRSNSVPEYAIADSVRKLQARRSSAAPESSQSVSQDHFLDPNSHVAEYQHPQHDAASSDISRQSYDAAADPYYQPPNPDFDDRNTLPERFLVTKDVLALVFNKMVGTGIFTTPALVLALTQSPSISILLWVIGGLYTALCLLVYIEFGTRYPYNGGELIYLDRLFSPGLLFTVFFSFYHIAFGNTTGNAIQFGLYVYVSSKNESEPQGSQISYWVVKLIAWCALSGTCLILIALPKLGMFLNKSLALFKVILLVVVFAKGIQLSEGEGSGRKDIQRSGDANFISNMSAFVYVIYSYTGWENGNYVAGEIRDLSETRKGPSGTKLLRGSMGAVILTTILYVLVVVAYYLSAPFEAIINNSAPLGLGADFSPRAFGDNGRTLNILIAISALGNLIAVVYTSGKIKQAIARQRFIPFWQFIESGSETKNGVPKGGLILHWITTTILIIALPIDKDGYTFIIGISTYGRVVIETGVFLGTLWLWYTSKNSFKVLRHLTFQAFLPVILIAANLLLLVVSAMEVNGFSETKKHIIPRYWWTVAIGSVFAAALLWWAGIQLLQQDGTRTKRHRNSSNSENIGLTGTGESSEALNIADSTPKTLGARLGLDIHVYQWVQDRSEQKWPDSLKRAMDDSHAEGSLRRVDARFTRHLPTWLHDSYKAMETWFLRHLC